MKKIWFLIFLLITFQAPILSEKTYTSKATITIMPHIGEDYISVKHVYEFEGEGISEFEVLTKALSYYNLRVYDSQGELSFEVGEIFLIGKERFRRILVHFRKPLSENYHFTLEYDYQTFQTGKPLVGKLRYNLKSTTDEIAVEYVIPLRNIELTSESQPEPFEVLKGENTRVSYKLTKDTKIILAYEPENGINYSERKRVSEKVFFDGEEYTFKVSYPKGLEVLAEDIIFFVQEKFPIFLEEIGIKPKYQKFEIHLTKEENSWAAARYYGRGVIEIYVNNTAAMPSHYLAHELTHSYLKDVPTFFEEGIAEYFEWRVESKFKKQIEGSYIPSSEWYFETYERQYSEFVDIRGDNYGFAFTEKQEALIYSKYDKASHLVFEIAERASHSTIKEMVFLITEGKDFEEMLYSLSQREKVLEIMRSETYLFKLPSPESYEVKLLLLEVKEDSWWSKTLLKLRNFNSRLLSEDPKALRLEILEMREFAARTYLFANLLLLFVAFISLYFIYKGKSRISNSMKTLIYLSPAFYLVIPLIAFISFLFLLYQLAINGAKPRFLSEEIILPFLGALTVSSFMMLYFRRYILRRKDELERLLQEIESKPLFNLLRDSKLFSELASIEWIWLYPLGIASFAFVLFAREIVLGQRFDFTLFLLGYLCSLAILYPLKRRVLKNLSQ
ncbi:MAG: hypothetical protein ACE5K0_03490 [Candidatus Methanofastidiosia archaeon]